jgi:hypothetical protein
MPYSDNRFLMPGGITSLMTSTNDEPLTNKQMKRAKDIIYNPNRTTNDVDELFIAEVKGYIPEEYVNDYLDFPPIIRAVEIKNSADVIGDYMSNLFNEYNPNSKKEYKLVNLLNTASPSNDKLEWMAFSTYYLWLLIDFFHFKITDIRTIITFDASPCFHEFVNTIMSKRIETINQ